MHIPNGISLDREYTNDDDIRRYAPELAEFNTQANGIAIPIPPGDFESSTSIPLQTRKLVQCYAVVLINQANLFLQRHASSPYVYPTDSDVYTLHHYFADSMNGTVIDSETKMKRQVPFWQETTIFRIHGSYGFLHRDDSRALQIDTQRNGFGVAVRPQTQEILVGVGDASEWPVGVQKVYVFKIERQ